VDVSSPRVGLVLGAGGVVGQAYHAGVLAALELDLGWDPRTADVIVGTSAGSVTGSLLRLDVSAFDLAAWAVNAPMSLESSPIMERLGADARQFPPPSIRDVLRPLRLPPVAMLRAVASRPWAFRPAVAATTMLAPGRLDLVSRVRRLESLYGEGWPAGLLICAARRSDGRRVVFGHPGRPGVPVADAVAASCAVPTYFRPVRINGVEYFDGGVHSSTNADVLAAADLDVVVVVAPMSAAHGRARTVDAAVRWSVHRRLERELRVLRARGVEIVRVEPGPRTLAEMGLNAMADDRSDRVVQAALIETGRRAATEPIASRLAVLALRPSRQRATGAPRPGPQRPPAPPGPLPPPGPPAAAGPPSPAGLPSPPAGTGGGRWPGARHGPAAGSSSRSSSRS
jgi:NTE family protein